MPVNLPKFSTLQLALTTSIAVHAVLLTVRFVDPESFRRAFEDTPLEVILVNTQNKELPSKAKAMAQTSLAGGGELDAGRATSPLPTSAVTENGDTQTQVAMRKLQSLEEQQNLLLSQLRNQLATLTPNAPKAAGQQSLQDEQEEQRKQLSKQLAEIERRINLENSRPKKRYLSPAVQETVYAVYYDQLRRKIEDRGTEKFPTAAGRKLYGELTMVITINHTGQVLDTEIAVSSGNSLLDKRAAAIARSAGPFGTFTSAMRQEADQIVLVSRFKFTREETLEATMGKTP
jgi:protein TonB